MSGTIKIKKGLNIPLKGKAKKQFVTQDLPNIFALKPTDFYNVTPKLKVKVGDKVKAGDTLFFDKKTPEIVFNASVSGEVKAVNRGERRKILEVVVERDKEIVYKKFEKQDIKELSREKVIQSLLEAGIWPLIVQRPYNIIANPKDTPKAIFVSSFDSSPLAIDNEFALKDNEKAFKAGMKAISKLTNEINIGVSKDSKYSSIFRNVGGNVYEFSGPHPAGNVGVQIHHISPINKGEVVWTLKPQDIVMIGKLFNEGIYDASRVVCLCGSEVKEPAYYKTLVGASIKDMLSGSVKEGKSLRYISGNVLTGKKTSEKGYIGFYDTQITVIPEGDDYELFGWASLGVNKFSASRTFASKFLPKKKFRLNANLNGGERAFVMSGQYDKVLPMDLLPEQLVKAVLVEDVDLMEKLGMYEVVEEDLALCEYVCTSKIEVQKILRGGFDLMIKELS